MYYNYRYGTNCLLGGKWKLKRAVSLLIKPFSCGCDMNCDYCFYTDVASSRAVKNYGKMSAAVVDEIIKKVFSDDVSEVYFTFQGGEPTLIGLDYYRDFVNKVTKSNKNEIKVSYSLQTNGLSLDDEFAEFFAQNDFLVGVSLDGDCTTNDLHRKDKNGESVYARVMRNIARLEKYKVKFNILSVVTDESADNIKKDYRFFVRHGFRYLQFIPCIENFSQNKITLLPKNYERFLKKLFDLWYDDFVLGKYISIRSFDNYLSILLGRAPENCAMGGRCGTYFVIESDGSLYPCDFYCLDKYRMGSIFDDEPFDNNKTHTRFVEEGEMPTVCKTCKYVALCRGGCRRYREPSMQVDKYCRAYRNFFDYAIERMCMAAKKLYGDK